MNTSEFYHDLAPCTGFAAALAGSCFQPVPADWIVAATDVVNSTGAIEAGRYKDVTVAGAISTISIANITGSLQFPFFFGGDGMTFMLPGSYRDQVLQILADVRRVVMDTVGLTLRAGVMDVEEINRLGADLCIGKVRITDRYTQAVASGIALDVVDRILKGHLEARMSYPPQEPDPHGSRADFSGFSCRWQDIPSAQGETLSLIIEQAHAGADGYSGLSEAQEAIESIVGDIGGAHPLTVEAQTTTAARSVAGPEATYRARGRAGIRYLLQRARIWIEVTLVRIALATGLPIRAMGKELRDIRRENIQNADVYKIDGTLKMTIAVTPEQRLRITERLEELRQDGSIHYGYHTSDRAIMTCLIHTNHNDEVHFVDSADGGYAVAARMLKSQR
jgi:hypothetical protein